MKKLVTSLFLLLTVVCYAAEDIVCVGAATEVIEGKDTLYIFKDEIHLKSNVGEIDWYDSDGNLIASNQEEIFPDDGCISAYGHSFCVELYKDIDDLGMDVELTCGTTILHVSGTLGARTRTYSLSYNALAWNTETWEDSAVVASGKLAPTIYMPPLYGPTSLRLSYDNDIRAKLGLDTAEVERIVTLEDIVAVKMQMTSLATARGKEGEKSNELNRPTSQTLITSSEYSAPLEVAFYSNPTPAARFYKWSIYQSSNLIVSRTDQDIRYTFMNPGSYRIVCSVNNADCTSDSTEMTVAISESYLRVPNVFTPNNDPGHKNEEFRVAYKSIKEFHIWVYNRWGKLVYESTDPSKGWDGTINGRPAAEGAYFYVIRALGTDADKNAKYMIKPAYDNKKKNSDTAILGVYQLSGDINLIR